MSVFDFAVVHLARCSGNSPRALSAFLVRVLAQFFKFGAKLASAANFIATERGFVGRRGRGEGRSTEVFAF